LLFFFINYYFKLLTVSLCGNVGQRRSTQWQAMDVDYLRVEKAHRPSLADDRGRWHALVGGYRYQITWKGLEYSGISIFLSVWRLTFIRVVTYYLAHFYEAL
jgi:hypothetical protein